MAERRKPSHGRGELVDWKPGQSGNPSGLSKLEGQMIRAAREEGLESVRFLVQVRDDQVVDAKGKREGGTPLHTTKSESTLPTFQPRPYRRGFSFSLLGARLVSSVPPVRIPMNGNPENR